MDFITQYQQTITRQNKTADPEQLRVVESLQELQIQLNARDSVRQGRLSGLLRALQPAVAVFSHTSPPKGRYIWGGVGRGKSWLMDLFFESVSDNKKLRINFQEFMQQIHISLEREKGRKDPLQIIARRFSERWRLICLDEFVVTDIADAMILHGLLTALYALRVTMVMTSNVPPDQLYMNGLQRERFLPAIDLIHNTMFVLELRGDLDYRTRVGSSYAGYFYPSGESVEQKMRQLFFEKVGPILGSHNKLLINKRYIRALRVSGNVVWFDFSVICGRPRSSRDYIELANRFSTLFISNVPLLDECNDDMAYRFIQLIDELYDRRIKVAISAALPPRQLYQGRQHAFEFTRTISRLEHMRKEYA